MRKEQPRRDAPDLVVLPPVIPLAMLALAILLEWLLPLGYLPRPLAPVSVVVGLLLVLGFVATAAWGALEFRRASTNIDPRRPALALVRTGPYRVTRNPMYLGFLLLFAGIGLLASLDWSLPILPVLWLGLDRLVVRREEAYLSAKFDAPYDDFRSGTRRWL